MCDDKTASPLRAIRHLLLWVPLVAVILQVLGMSLVLPSRYGLDDYLGTVFADAANAITAQWQGYALWKLPLDQVAALYLAFDTGLFMPLYGALFLALGDKFLCATARDGRRSEPWFRAVMVGSVLALLVFDLVENLIGLARLGTANFLGGVVLAAALALPLGWWVQRRWQWWLAELGAFFGRVGRRRLLAAVIALVVIIAALAAWSLAKDSKLVGAGPLLILGGVAHLSKTAALVLYALLLSGLTAAWFFGFYLPVNAPEHDARASFRRAVGDMLVRCRYVWFALAVFAGLALVMNQGRDVVYSVAAMEPGAERQFAGVGGVVVALASAIGMWVFGFTTWLWSRSVCLMRAPQTPRPDPESALSRRLSYEDRAARDLARFLGLLPALLFVLLCGSTMHDAVMAGEHDVAGRLLAFILLAVAGGFVFVFQHTSDAESRYYDYLDFSDWDARTRQRGKNHFRLFYVITPFWLPFCAAAAMFACRLVAVGIDGSSLGPWPPMVLATFLFALTFWLSLFGWLSLNEERIAMPWVSALVVLVGVMGYTGLMRNHVVGGAVGIKAPESDLVPTLIALLLAVVCLLLFGWIVGQLRRQQLTFWKGGRVSVVALLAAAGVVYGGGALLAPQTHQPVVRRDPPTLDKALADWLGGLYADNNPKLSDNTEGDLPVYFVDAEGGGIRSAYWTALVLQRLKADVPLFANRTFSYSGVSGGSVGFAVDRACGLSGTADCVEQFGNADLITPLISTWLFEDVLAQILPTRWCGSPACGTLSRGVHFENAILRAVPGIEAGVSASRASNGHLPYLFLNSTWVETGERAIASEVRIRWQDFPAARDQLALLESDLSLGTAAHNSARFPFINAIGALLVPPGACKPDPNTGTATPGAKDAKPEICGHLADGGYFDNSGAHTTANILDGLAVCLSANPEPACAGLSADARAWLRRHLAPQVIAIRNGTHPLDDERERCVEPTILHGPDLTPKAFDRADDRYQPGRPECKGQTRLYADALGPVVTAFNAIGTGANGKLSEADLTHKLQTVVGGLRPPPCKPADTARKTPARCETQAPETTRRVVNIDLIEDGRFLYPLGWHLSPIARQGMKCQSGDPALLHGVAGASAKITQPASNNQFCPEQASASR